jgi:hypothetical protein
MASFVSRSLIRSLRKLKKNQDDLIKEAEKLGGVYKGTFKMSLKDIDISALSDLIEQMPDAAAKAHKMTMEIICNDLHAALDEAIEATVWEWSDGKTRDIFDTGQLLESGSVEFDPSAGNIIIRYGANYAAIVHFGGIVRSPWQPGAEIYYPARPWIEAVLTGNGPVPRFDFSKAYEENFYRFMEKEIGL